jgi:uncharacterized membrane protein (UPF0136 family)
MLMDLFIILLVPTVFVIDAMNELAQTESANMVARFTSHTFGSRGSKSMPMKLTTMLHLEASHFWQLHAKGR